MDTNAHAECAEGSGVALPPTVETRSGTAILQVRVETRASGVRLPRRVTNQLVVLGRHLEWTPLAAGSPELSRSLWWTQLSELPTWLIQVVDEAGELIDMGSS
jgi:hypothetical protein